MKVYGIANCDSVKAVRKALDNANKPYEFIDFKTAPPDINTLRRWHEALGEALVNRQSRTWKANKATLEAAQTQGGEAFLQALALYPLVLKRPIVETQGRITNGKSALSLLPQKTA